MDRVVEHFAVGTIIDVDFRFVASSVRYRTDQANEVIREVMD